MTKSLSFLPLIFAAAFAFAQPASEDVMARAQALMDQGRELRDAAEAEYRAREPECYDRFLVNRCLSQAREKRMAIIREARALEIAGRRMELEEKQRIAAEKDLPDRYVGSDGIPPAPTQPATPTSDAPAEAIRAQRAAEAERAEAKARIELRARDVERSESRAEAEAAAAERAEKAARGRERYDERIRERARED